MFIKFLGFIYSKNAFSGSFLYLIIKYEAFSWFGPFVRPSQDIYNLFVRPFVPIRVFFFLTWHNSVYVAS
jgi:hypothetical protein